MKNSDISLLLYIYNRLVSHFAPQRLTHLNYSATILHFVSHYDTWCYIYNTLLHYKQIIYFNDISLIRITEDIINVTKIKYYDTK